MSNVPAAFLCPITQQIMQDPVQDRDGNSYERAAITQWLQQHGTSPITRRPMTVAELVPNRGLRDAIEIYQGGAALPPQNAGGQRSTPTRSPPPVRSSDSSRTSSPTPKGRTRSPTPTREDVGKLEVAVSASPPSSDGACNMMVSLKPPKGIRPTPVAIVCVIDVSGSMGSSATIQTESGSNEGHGLTILDIVKHALKTIIASLTENDCLALVAFSSKARTVMSITVMDDAGQARANRLVDELDADGTTNLWGGLQLGMDVLHKADGSAIRRHGAVLLFTDGEPNVEPPRGHIPSLKQYIEKNGLPGVINTFGFGYSLDSKLLYELAVVGNGTYAFIPDASFVGTIFVHAVANHLVSFAELVTVTIEPLNGATFLEPVDAEELNTIVLGGHRAKLLESPLRVEVDLGPMQYEQNKEIVIKLSNTPIAGREYAQIIVNYRSFISPEVETIAIKGTQRGGNEIVAHSFRLQFVDVVREGMTLAGFQDYDKAAAELRQLVQIIKATELQTPNIKALLQDAEGQATLAFKPDFYKKWGKHYLPSLAFAHLHQFCNNFKDPGVQGYATGEMFKSLRDRIDEIFCSLPPPTPTGYVIGGGSSGRSTTPVNMRTFNNASNPCFAGDTLVLLADGTVKPTCQVRKGDLLRTSPKEGGSGSAKVVCVVVSPCAKGETELVELPGGLRITPWHPVCIAGEWRFPFYVSHPVRQVCPAVYNFVLESDHVVIVNGVECVTLGHGLSDKTLKHEFFGTDKVVKCLQKLNGWLAGEVVVEGVVRDPTSGLICGLYQPLTPATQCSGVPFPLEEGTRSLCVEV